MPSNIPQGNYFSNQGPINRAPGQQSIQVVDGMVTLGGSSHPGGRIQSANHGYMSQDPTGITMTNASDAYKGQMQGRSGNLKTQIRPVGGSMDITAFQRAGMATSGALQSNMIYAQKVQDTNYGSQTGGLFSSTNYSNRLNSATGMTKRKPNIRLGSGSGPSSNIFSVKNGKLQLTNKSSILQV